MVMIQDLMERLKFPSDAQEDFLAALDRISKDDIADNLFASLLQQYEESECCSYEQMLTDVRILGESLGIHEYTISMLLFLCMAEPLKSRYAERGIDESIYYNSRMDLSYKLEECRLVYGVNGSFVADWFPGFFDLTRFALGRLQFEIVKTKEEYQVGGSL